MVHCPRCGIANQPASKFCLSCGAPLGAPQPGAGPGPGPRRVRTQAGPDPGAPQPGGPPGGPRQLVLSSTARCATSRVGPAAWTRSRRSAGRTTGVGRAAWAYPRRTISGRPALDRSRRTAPYGAPPSARLRPSVHSASRPVSGGPPPPYPGGPGPGQYGAPPPYGPPPGGPPGGPHRAPSEAAVSRWTEVPGGPVPGRSPPVRAAALPALLRRQLPSIGSGTPEGLNPFGATMTPDGQPIPPGAPPAEPSHQPRWNDPAAYAATAPPMTNEEHDARSARGCPRAEPSQHPSDPSRLTPPPPRSGRGARSGTRPAATRRASLAGFFVSFEGSELGAFWPIYQGRNEIGRKGAADGLHIEIDHPTTSSRHAVLLASARPGADQARGSRQHQRHLSRKRQDRARQEVRAEGRRSRAVRRVQRHREDRLDDVAHAFDSLALPVRAALLGAFAALLVLARLALVARAAPEAHILRIDPRAAQENGNPILTTRGRGRAAEARQRRDRALRRHDRQRAVRLHGAGAREAVRAVHAVPVSGTERDLHRRRRRRRQAGEVRQPRASGAKACSSPAWARRG